MEIIEVTNISNHGFWLYINGKEYFLSFDHFPWFKDARIKEINHISLLHGHHVCWPALDIDLTIDMIQHPENYPLTYKR